MHRHGHADGATESPEQRQALLAYMVAHNKSHAEELHELAHGLDGQAAELVHQAVELFDQGNAKLESALQIIKGE